MTSSIHAEHPTHPVEEHRIDLPDGRRLALAGYGDPGGSPVAFLPAAPGSRLIDPDPRATAAAGVRLLVVDRPGYGGSTPLPAGPVPSLAGLAGDVADGLAALDVRDVGVVGWSTGGSVALALAARHPDLVRAVALAGTPAPDDEVPWIPEEHRPVLAAMHDDPGAGVATLTRIFEPMATAMAADVAQVGMAPADARLLEDDAARGRVLAMLAEAFRPGVAGLATDIVAANVVPPGFDPAAIGAPVALFYGDGDVHVPPEHGRWWASRLGAPTLHVVAGAGHLVPLMAWPQILESVT